MSGIIRSSDIICLPLVLFGFCAGHTRDYLGINDVFEFNHDDRPGPDKHSALLAQVKGGRFVVIEE